MPKRTAAKPAGTTAQVQLDVRADTPSYYANFVLVSHTPYDFTVTVAKVPSPLTPTQTEAAKNGKPMAVEAMLQVILPPLLVDGLIKALTTQKELHAQTVAQQEKNNEQQHKRDKPLDSLH
jgi:hypothetical protein